MESLSLSTDEGKKQSAEKTATLSLQNILFFPEDAHKKLLRKVKIYIERHPGDNYGLLLTALEEENFAKALRLVCSVDNRKLAALLINYLETKADKPVSDYINHPSPFNALRPQNAGMTTLHFAAKAAQKESKLIELLIKHGANQAIRDASGKLYSDYFSKKINDTLTVRQSIRK